MRCRALVANLLVAMRDVTPERVAEFVEGGLPFLRAELMLRHSPAEAVAESQRIVDLFVELGLARAAADGAVRAADRYSPSMPDSSSSLGRCAISCAGIT